MEKYTLCILDDKIPVKNFTDVDAEDTGPIDINLMRHYLKSADKWEDKDLFDLTEKLIHDGRYLMTGFTNHQFYFNYISDTVYCPDIIIFDWDVGGADTDTSENLFRLLEKTFCLIGVFTSADNDGKVKNELDKEQFVDYKDRVFLIHKGEEKAIEELQNEIDRHLEHFSFKKGKELKSQTLKALDVVLSNLGAVSFDQFISFFGENDGGMRKISSLEFADIVIEKLKPRLLEKQISDISTGKVDKITDLQLCRKLWNYRLYYSPSDDIVRKGDIVRSKKAKTDNKLFMVISSDCHLNQFWKKNVGSLVVVPLYKVTRQHNSSLLKRLKQCKISDPVGSSLTNSSGGVNVLPGIFNKDKKIYEDYILLPRDITSFQIILPSGIGANNRLEYKHINDLEGKGRIRLADQFLEPLTQYIVNNVSGYGVPDYTKEFRNLLNQDFKKIIK